MVTPFCTGLYRTRLTFRTRLLFGNMMPRQNVLTKEITAWLNHHWQKNNILWF